MGLFKLLKEAFEIKPQEVKPAVKKETKQLYKPLSVSPSSTPLYLDEEYRKQREEQAKQLEEQMAKVKAERMAKVGTKFEFSNGIPFEVEKYKRKNCIIIGNFSFINVEELKLILEKYGCYTSTNIYAKGAVLVGDTKSMYFDESLEKAKSINENFFYADAIQDFVKDKRIENWEEVLKEKKEQERKFREAEYTERKAHRTCNICKYYKHNRDEDYYYCSITKDELEEKDDSASYCDDYEYNPKRK